MLTAYNKNLPMQLHHPSGSSCFPLQAMGASPRSHIMTYKFLRMLLFVRICCTGRPVQQQHKSLDCPTLPDVNLAWWANPSHTHWDSCHIASALRRKSRNRKREREKWLLSTFMQVYCFQCSVNMTSSSIEQEQIKVVSFFIDSYCVGNAKVAY